MRFLISIKKIHLYLYFKRVFDLSFVILLSPIILIFIFLLIIINRIILGPNIFFIQSRPGYNCKPFNLYKFRTMSFEKDDKNIFLPDNYRLSKYGKFLRASSLDELPSFLNVLKGQMSMVGPRPLLLEYIDKYTENENRRHNVRPGITGWAQVNGRNSIGWEEKFKLDLWYVENYNLFLDIKILFMTLKKIFFRENINASELVTMESFIDFNKRRSQNEK